ncbi:MAG: dienelactone hydrolase family protein [Sandaracinaceae bacterium]
MTTNITLREPSTFELSTKDGLAKTQVVTPTGAGPWPAVVLFFDAGGLRPSQTRIAQRIAKGGYAVFIPDLFHRAPPLEELLGEAVSMDAVRRAFNDPVLRPKFFAGYYGPALDYTNLETTIGALLDHLATRDDLTGRVGTTGYCMGGNASFRAGTIFGERIAATAAFHPGGLVTDQPDSPHTRASRIRARVYLGPSTDDLPPEEQAKLVHELEAGSVDHRIDRYEARHGYAVDDSPVYDRAAAERHDAALSELYGATLRG